MSRACRGRLKRIIKARRKPFVPAPISACMKTSGRRPKKSSSRRKCGIRASIIPITRAQPIESPLFVGVDVGIKHDNAARVAVKWDEQGEKLILVSHRIWKPTPLKPLDLENTVEQDLRDLNDWGDVVEIVADPYQMHRSITTLQAAGIPIREFPQTQANCTLMGQTLFDLLTGQNLVLYPSDELRQQALSTVAVENPRGWRIAKEKASKKIDAIVALAMACVAAMAHRAEIGNRAARGFNPSQHVTEAVKPFHGPVYMGQTFELPATVIAQSDQRRRYRARRFRQSRDESTAPCRDLRQALACGPLSLGICRPPLAPGRGGGNRDRGAVQLRANA